MKEEVKMIKILFVCLGNICRSPMAEFIMKDLVKKNNLQDKIQIASAATCYDEIGNDMYLQAQATLNNHNIPYTKHSARIITKEDYNNFDYIVAMEDSNIRRINNIVGEDTDNKVCKLLDFTGTSKDIEDPWYTRNFEKVYNEIYEGCQALLKVVEL